MGKLKSEVGKPWEKIALTCPDMLYTLHFDRKGEVMAWLLKLKTSYGHAIALWKKHCEIDQKRLII